MTEALPDEGWRSVLRVTVVMGALRSRTEHSAPTARRYLMPINPQDKASLNEAINVAARCSRLFGADAT
jgi:hypothetical protein